MSGIGPFVIFMQTQGSHKEIKEALSNLGIRGEGYTDPRAFLRRLKDDHPVACLLDLSFDDAPIVLAVIKSIRTVLGSKLPLIGLIAQNDRLMEPKAREYGATDFIHKPFDEDELISTIAKHVQAPEGEEVEAPKSIKWFFEKISPALAGLGVALGATGALEAQVRFYDIRLRARKENFIGLIKSLRKTESEIDLSQAIRMYGARNTRNLVVALKLSDVTFGSQVYWHSKTGALTGDPKQILKYSMKTADFFGEGSRNESEAFSSGLVLDLLCILAESAGSRKPAVLNFIAERYDIAMKMATRCIAAAKSAKSLMLERHIITSILMCEAGKVAMAIFYPEFLDMYRKTEKVELAPALQHVLELRNFAVSHNLMGALICQGAPGLSDAYKSVLFFDYPYMLADVEEDKDAYDLIRVCNPAVVAV